MASISKSHYLRSKADMTTVHTVMLIIIIFIFAFTAYSTNANLGSPVYDLLVEAGKRHPVEGNAEGSYLTMRSREGAIFFVINIVGNFGTVFCDNGKQSQTNLAFGD